MRSQAFLTTVFLVASAAILPVAAPADAAPARAGCRHGNGLGSDNASSGINANAPSRANTNPCSSLYDNGINVRRMEKRRYPNAIVRH